jgi:hypothetical protein
MVEDGLLEVGGTTATKLSLVAVAYHNKAVDYLLDKRVRRFDCNVAMTDAAVSRLHTVSVYNLYSLG